MAKTIISNHLLPNVDEYYGNEVSLCYPGLYAGTTDCVAQWQGKLSILDFKQTNKPKKEEYIDDYFMQLAAYICAHDELYSTTIERGVILMCSVDLQPQHWVLEGDRLEHYKTMWTERVKQYYRVS